MSVHPALQKSIMGVLMIALESYCTSLYNLPLIWLNYATPPPTSLPNSAWAGMKHFVSGENKLTMSDGEINRNTAALLHDSFVFNYHLENMPTSNSSFNSGLSFPLVLMMHIFTKKKNEKNQLTWNNPCKWFYSFFFFKASHLLKTVLLKYLCGHFYLEVHFQIQSLLCVGSLLLLLPDAAPPAVSCVPDSPRNMMRDKNLSRERVREKCRKELCINPTVWGGLVLFWNHTISLLQIPFFFVIAQTHFQEVMLHCNILRSQFIVLHLFNLHTGHWTKKRSLQCSSFFCLSYFFFFSVSLWFVSSSGWL